MPTSTVIGAGMAAYLDCDEVLPLPEFHPTSHAGFQLAVTREAGIITSADMRIGFMHRSFEKLFESRDYRQLMVLADRYDWLSAFSSELVIALVFEASAGIVPPERATWARMLLAEANRVTATLAFLSPMIDGAPKALAQSVHEQLITAQEMATGSRVHPMFARIGGVAAPISDEALAAYARAITSLEEALPQIGDAMHQYAATLAGLAPLSRESAVGCGASGAVARASGLDFDLRRDDPYLAYTEVADLLAVPTRTAGDAQARYEVLLEQLPSSLAIMGASIDKLVELGPGPIDVRLPKTVRAPEGTSYGWIEGPLGISGVLLVSVGEPMPWRLKLRSASFANAQAMQKALVGTGSDKMADAVMSFFLVAGDIDR